MDGAGGRVMSRWRHAAGLAAVCVLYFAVFRTGFAWAEHGFYHRYFDQVSYRFEAAQVASAFAGGGLVEGLRAAWTHATAQGLAYPLAGGLAHTVGLDPTDAVFALFLLALLVVFAVLGRGDPALGWLAIALVAASTTLLNKTGGPLDFRPDFLGQCLWAVIAAAALQSRAFASRGCALLVGLGLGLAATTRSLTVAYAAAALPLCALAAAIGVPARRAGRGSRLVNLTLAGLVAAAIAAPFLAGHFDKLRDYYLDNHISARENEARGYHGSFGRYLGAYARSLLRNHVGWPAMGLAVATLGLTLASRGRTALRQAVPLLPIGIAGLAPLPVLALGPQFSDTVSGIASGPFLWLALLPALATPAGPPLDRRLVAIVVAIGLALFPARFLHKCAADHDKRLAAGHHLVAGQHRAILAHAAGRPDVLLTTLPLIEAHSLAMLELVGYETTRRLPGCFRYGLGHSIYACASAEEFAARLRASDVVLWWDGGASGGELPANREAAQRRELIVAVLADHFTPANGDAREILLEGRPLRLYFRR